MFRVSWSRCSARPSASVSSSSCSIPTTRSTWASWVPRAAVRCCARVSQTIGLDGEQVVPSDDELEKKEQQQKEQAGTAGDQPAGRARGSRQGVQSGVQKITSELTAGLAARAQMPDGRGMPGAGGHTRWSTVHPACRCSPGRAAWQGVRRQAAAVAGAGQPALADEQPADLVTGR